MGVSLHGFVLAGWQERFSEVFFLGEGLRKRAVNSTSGLTQQPLGIGS